MKYKVIVAGLLAAVAAPASAMDVQTFLTKAEALKAKGPLALLSDDLKLLTGQIKADGEALRQERLAAVARKRKPTYCPPAKADLGSDDVLAAMQAVPAAQRARTSTKDAMRAYFARRWPCPK